MKSKCNVADIMYKFQPTFSGAQRGLFTSALSDCLSSGIENQVGADFSAYRFLYIV